MTLVNLLIVFVHISLNHGLKQRSIVCVAYMRKVFTNNLDDVNKVCIYLKVKVKIILIIKSLLTHFLFQSVHLSIHLAHTIHVFFVVVVFCLILFL